MGAAAPRVVPHLPPLPKKVVERFPELKQWESEADKKWREEFAMSLGWPLTRE